MADLNDKLTEISDRLQQLESRGSIDREAAASVLRLIDRDDHTWQDRPCPTCRTVTAFLGKPFGCNRTSAQASERRRAGRPPGTAR